jgi:putative membrane protein
VLAIGVMLATKIIPGIAYDTGTTLLVVVLLLSFFNVILKPLLVLFTLPFIILTMGLGMIVINALLFLFVGKLVDGFQVSGFWAALGGALIVSVTNLIFTRMLAPPADGPPAGEEEAGRRDRRLKRQVARTGAGRSRF